MSENVTVFGRPSLGDASVLRKHQDDPVPESVNRQGDFVLPSGDKTDCSNAGMLARRPPTILPDRTLAETPIKIQRAASRTNGNALHATRPLRWPAYRIAGAPTGGRAIPKPGEGSLAWPGVLFLDALPGFRKKGLAVFHSLLEDTRATIARPLDSVSSPTHILLVADILHLRPYRARAFRPLRDRVDMQAEGPAVQYREPSRGRTAENPTTFRVRANCVRQVKLTRFSGRRVFCKAPVTRRNLRRFCQPGESGGAKLLENAMARLGLSPQASPQILKVARTLPTGEEHLDGARLGANDSGACA